MLESIIGSFIFDFIGASAKWLFHFVKNKIKGEKVVSFKAFQKKKKGASFKESVEDDFSNVALGMIIVVIIIAVGIMLIK